MSASLKSISVGAPRVDEAGPNFDAGIAQVLIARSALEKGLGVHCEQEGQKKERVKASLLIFSILTESESFNCAPKV